MCGINGFNFKDRELIEKMNERTRHRGPDDGGFFLAEEVSLGSRRLAVIDISPAGHQPMTSADGRYTIVYNGELYNFPELRREMEGRGAKFRSHSDTEVLLELFAREGPSCFKRLNGIFAFAIWDNFKKKLYLARDPAGVKPLYYYLEEGKLIFSSEIKALLEHKFKAVLNRTALNLYFRFLYVPAPLTMWEGIKKFSAGHFGVLSGKNFEIKPFWELPEGEYLKSEEEAKHLVREKFFAAVKRQLISDRPLGLFLSGGIDSTAILAAMSKELGGGVKTFSVGFETPIQGERYNADFLLARKSAEYFKAKHHELVISGRHLQKNFEKIIWHLDEPISNPIQGATYLLSEFARKEVVVTFGGDGGDELFGGYSRYWYNFQIEAFGPFLRPFLPDNFLKGLERISGREGLGTKMSSSNLERFLSFMAQKEDRIERFLRPEINDAGIAKDAFEKYFLKNWQDNTNQMMAADFQTWLQDESLLRTDKLTMAHGLEERVPILDLELVKLAFRIPSKFKVGTRFQGKRIFREALKADLPSFVLQEEKRGWFSPASKWLRGDLKEFAREVLSENYCSESANLFDFKEIQKMLGEHLESKSYHLNILWALLTFQVWARQFLK
ncbi:MAG: asparagine synthase (glutamine-hydrolyzing) [bacterium]|nr:asparagine synthase (glutamine-hydrolyzing) [bacterium]